jgi:DNA primase catalytic core
MRENRFREFLDHLKDHLPQYLTEVLQVEIISGKFRCLHPQHEDKNPSMSFVSPAGDRLVRCHSCLATGSIFEVASWVRGLPTRGPDFVKVTIPTLAQDLGIRIPEGLQTNEQDSIETWTRQIYAQVHELLLGYCDRPLNQPGGDRGWSTQLKREWGVATIPWNDFQQQLRRLSGVTLDELHLLEITPRIFNDQGATYTIFNHHGAPVGFSLRDMRHQKGVKSSPPKFVNTSARVLCFRKREILYGYHRCARESGVVPEIVEGYADVISAYAAGLKGHVATLGTSLTAEHLELMASTGKTSLVFSMDGDKAGREATEKALQTAAEHSQIRTRVRDLSQAGDKIDPDEFFRARGASAAQDWALLPLIDGFDWLLRRQPRATEDEQVLTAERMVPVVASEPSNVRREHLLRRLAEYLQDVRVEALQRDLDTHLNREAADVQDKISSVQKTLHRRLTKTDTDGARIALAEAIQSIENIQQERNVDTLSMGWSIGQLREFRGQFEQNDPVLPGFRTGLTHLDSKLRGLPRTGEFWVLAGLPNIGKSSLATFLSWQVAKLNKDAAVLYLTSDDSARPLVAKIISMETRLLINAVTSPKVLRPDQKEKHEAAWQMLEKYTAEHRWNIRDRRAGTTPGFLQRWVDETRKKCPDRNVLVIVDSLHKMRRSGGVSDAEDMRAAVTDISNALKDLPVTHGVGLVSVAELRKATNPRRPVPEDIRETMSVYYDAAVIGMFHQTMHIDPNTQDDVWEDIIIDPQGKEQTERKPIVTIYWDKNKSEFSGYKGQTLLRFDPARCTFYDHQDDITGAGGPAEDRAVPVLVNPGGIE